MDSSLFEMFGYLSDLVNDAIFDIINFSLLVQSHGIHRRKYQSDCECHACKISKNSQKYKKCL